MKVSISYSENIHFTAKARSFTGFHIDEPESFHGTDLGPSSTEYLLIGIGGCMGSSLAYCLQKRKIKIKDMEIIVDGKLKVEGPKNHLRLAKVNVELFLSLKKGNSSQNVDTCINNFLEYCVLTNSVIQGIPIDIKVNKKE